MAETEQDDEKRRQRARFVDALATSAQQPGERSRVGTRIAGAVAVLALAAGATLGLGAWRAYQNAEDEKAKQLAAERVAAQHKLTEASTPSAEEREKKRKEVEKKKEAEERKKEEAEERKRQQAAAEKAAAEVAKPPPSPPAPAKTEKPNSPRNSGIELPRSKVVLKNVASGKCADLPGLGPGKPGTIINEHRRCYPTDQDNQLWNIRVHYADRGPGGAPLVDIRGAKDGLCMDVPTRGPQPAGTPLSLAYCLPDIDKDNQLWWLEPADDGSVKIRNYSSNHQCLRAGPITQDPNNRRLILESCTDGPESRWRLQG